MFPQSTRSERYRGCEESQCNVRSDKEYERRPILNS